MPCKVFSTLHTPRFNTKMWIMGGGGEHIFICTNIILKPYVYMYMYIYMHICMYTFIFVFAYIYTHILMFFPDLMGAQSSGVGSKVGSHKASACRPGEDPGL